MTATQIVLSGLLLFTAVCGVVDYRTGHIPNRIVAVGAALGLAFHVAVHVALLRSGQESVGDLLASAATNVALGLVACGIVPLLLFRVNAMGGGDVKLLAACGIWVGPIIGLQVELYAFVLAAIYAPARLAYHGQLFRLLGNSATLIKNPFLPKSRRKEVPQELLTELRFGPVVFAAAGLVALLRWRFE